MELQWPHGRHGAKMFLQARRTHTYFRSEPFDAEPFPEVLPNPGDGAADLSHPTPPFTGNNVDFAEAQQIGEIDTTFDPMELAEFLLASWEGAILRMKVERGPAPLERFRKIIFQTVLKETK